MLIRKALRSSSLQHTRQAANQTQDMGIPYASPPFSRAEYVEKVVDENGKMRIIGKTLGSSGCG